jgi:hypothetical protein
LGFNDRERRQRSTAAGIAHLRGTLQQPRVEIKHVSGKRLTSGRPTQQQRELTIGNGVLRKIVIDQ